jgi:peroxiredoxin
MGYRTEAPPAEADGYRRLTVGDPAPWFEQATSGHPRLRLDLAAGRYLVLCFFMGTDDPAGRRALELVAQNRDLFDDARISFFGVTVKWQDQYDRRTLESLPGVRYFWDFDLKVSALYGAVPANAGPGVVNVRRCWFILDPTLRIISVIRFEKDGSERARVLDVLRNLPGAGDPGVVEAPPPVLYLPNCLEPDLCRRLVAAFEADPAAARNVGTRRRLDRFLEDTDLIAEVGLRIRRRVAPEVARAFQFEATRTAPHVIACYGEGASLAPRREEASGTRAQFGFSVSLNEDYDGGEISFPEYGRLGYRPPLGTALVFSDSILHRIAPVRRGQRYVCQTFLYGGEAAHQPDEAWPARDELTPPLLPEYQDTPPPVRRTGDFAPLDALPNSAARR